MYVKEKVTTIHTCIKCIQCYYVVAVFNLFSMDVYIVKLLCVFKNSKCTVTCTGLINKVYTEVINNTWYWAFSFRNSVKYRRKNNLISQVFDMKVTCKFPNSALHFWWE